jgi:hypothetical protein
MNDNKGLTTDDNPNDVPARRVVVRPAACVMLIPRAKHLAHPATCVRMTEILPSSGWRFTLDAPLCSAPDVTEIK